jgi:hypothetical protein
VLALIAVAVLTIGELLKPRTVRATDDGLRRSQ